MPGPLQNLLGVLWKKQQHNKNISKPYCPRKAQSLLPFVLNEQQSVAPLFFHHFISGSLDKGYMSLPHVCMWSKVKFKTCGRTIPDVTGKGSPADILLGQIRGSLVSAPLLLTSTHHVQNLTGYSRSAALRRLPSSWREQSRGNDDLCTRGTCVRVVGSS